MIPPWLVRSSGHRNNQRANITSRSNIKCPKKAYNDAALYLRFYTVAHHRRAGCSRERYRVGWGRVQDEARYTHWLWRVVGVVEGGPIGTALLWGAQGLRNGGRRFSVGGCLQSLSDGCGQVCVGVATQAWKEVMAWWKVSGVFVSSVDDAALLADRVFILAKLKKDFDVVVNTTLWHMEQCNILVQVSEKGSALK
ncbi:hypothetical protein Tco_0373413 [Tanacetum coccineum]